jgi:ketosteroid isomerase-like protein
MSRENVEVVRRCYEQLSGTGELLWELADADVEFEFAWMDGRGVEAWRRAVSAWADTFEEWQIEAREFVDIGPSQVIAIVRDRGRLKGSGAEIDNEFFHLWTIRNGLATRFEAFTDMDDALEAVGLSE